VHKLKEKIKGEKIGYYWLSVIGYQFRHGEMDAAFVHLPA